MPAAVIPSIIALSSIGVTLVAVGVLIAYIRLKQNRTPVTVRFSNKHQPGSLAKMLKVFKVQNWV